MKKQTIVIPKGIRYISEWKELKEHLPVGETYILNKTITGCGYTEYCITNDEPMIICSPRKILLENKEGQHLDMRNLLYVKDEYAKFEPFDMDLSKKVTKLNKKELKAREKEKAAKYTEHMKKKIRDHWFDCNCNSRGACKYLVTYDSFRRVKEALGSNINQFTIVVDEFQSIFTDARFKSDTENIFLDNLKDLKKVVYLSATPMLDMYLEELDTFKDLTYITLDWATEDPNRVIRPILKTKQIRSIVEEAKRVIDAYKDGKFVSQAIMKDGKISIVDSTEAVLYVNSVKNICDIIRCCNLQLSETNVLCSDDNDNKKSVRDAFKSVDPTVLTDTICIGTVPKKGEPHKMFTLCTRTVYLGADFYSLCARSFIFSDANIDCLSVDITLDLPQILGRQRLDENPWKNQAELYYKTNTRGKTQEEFKSEIVEKNRRTENLLKVYNETKDPALRHSLAEKFQSDANKSSYKNDYVSVNTRAGSDLVPVFNKLMMLSEIRAFEIQQYDYKDRFSVFNALEKKVVVEDLNTYIETFFSYPNTSDKYRFLCSLDENTASAILSYLPSNFQNYYTVLGPDRIRANGYNVTEIKKEYETILNNQEIDISKEVQKEFNIGEKITKKEVKTRLKKLYDTVGYKRTPKAVDLGDYFYIRDCKIPKDDGSRDHGYEIIKIKENTGG